MQLQEQLEIIGLKTFIMKDKHIFQKLGKKMASDPYIGLSRQETYDLNIEVVKKWIKSDQYFDPKRFLKNCGRLF